MAEKPVFIPRDKLVEQFMPVGENSDPKIANVNYLISQIQPSGASISPI